MLNQKNVSVAIIWLFYIPCHLCSVSDEYCDSDYSCGWNIPKSKFQDNDLDVTRCKNFSIADFNSESPSIIYLESRGRFGNQIYTYGLLHQIAEETKTQPFLHGYSKRLLKTAFDMSRLTIPILEEKFCNTKDIFLKTYQGKLSEFLENPEYHKGKLIWLYPPQSNGRSYGGYWASDHGEEDFFANFTLRMENSIRKLFLFKPEVIEAADKVFTTVTESFKKENPKLPITFVGIHNRRTDHLNFMRKLSNSKPLKSSYFKDGMQYFRDEFENVAFLFVSDDMNWGRKYLKNNSGDLFFVGRGTDVERNGPADNWDSVDAAVDFAVLARCNHSIISRGSYSSFSAVLANGEIYTERGVVVPPHLLYLGQE